MTVLGAATLVLVSHATRLSNNFLMTDSPEYFTQFLIIHIKYLYLRPVDTPYGF